MGGAEENSVIQTQQGWHTGELTEAVTRGTAPAQAQTRQHPGTQKGEWTQGPPLTKKSFAMGTCWERALPKEAVCGRQVREEAVHLLGAAASVPDSLSPSSGVSDSPEGP